MVCDVYAVSLNIIDANAIKYVKNIYAQDTKSGMTKKWYLSNLDGELAKSYKQAQQLATAGYATPCIDYDLLLNAQDNPVRYHIGAVKHKVNKINGINKEIIIVPVKLNWSDTSESNVSLHLQSYLQPYKSGSGFSIYTFKVTEITYANSSNLNDGNLSQIIKKCLQK
jgi:hypothetical protein